MYEYPAKKLNIYYRQILKICPSSGLPMVIQLPSLPLCILQYVGYPVEKLEVEEFDILRSALLFWLLYFRMCAYTSKQ